MLENFFISPALALTCLAGLCLYYLPPLRRLQVPLVLIASFFIYWLAGGYLILLLLCSALTTALFSYASAYTPHGRRLAMLSGVSVNLFLLIFFKYKHLLMPPVIFNNWFGGDTIWRTLYMTALPIGISFYAFHGISLIVDSYRNREVLAASGHDLITHVKKTLLYISFFPQIVAGPIAKGKFFYPQIIPKRFADIDWVGAARALAYGYFMKEVIANNLNQYTAPMTDHRLWALTPSSEMLWMMVGYSAQIFADFAGYSSIAIGLAKLFGYELPINSHRPYFAVSFADFWQRWHISLSSWLRDYLYVPLGGNRKGRLRTYVNLMLVMFLGGLWHGPEWRYATWGVVHGLALAVERWFARENRRPETTKGILRIGRTLGVFAIVSVAWLFFRLDSVTDVMHYFQAIVAWHRDGSSVHDTNITILAFLCGLVLLQHLLSLLRERGYLEWAMRYEGYFAGALIALCLVARGKESAFIYFQF